MHGTVGTVIVIAASAVLLAVCLFQRTRLARTRRAQRPDEYAVYESTESETRARAGRILPLEGSEDATHLVGVETLLDRSRLTRERHRGGPDEQVEWIVDIEPVGATRIQRKHLLSAFGRDWSMQHGRPLLYGIASESGHWTYPFAQGVPETYAKLSLAWDLADSVRDEGEVIPSARLEAYLKAVTVRVRKLGDVRVRARTSPDEGAERGAHFKAVYDECKMDVAVVLSAPQDRTFDGRDIWDTMLCLGLRWGDMDVFHLENEAGAGDQYFFSVWTSTPPGYFFPEEIAAGRVHVQDLVFGYQVPRSAAPLLVFDSMMKAAEYAKQRLGGTLLDANGNPLDPAALRSEIAATVERMETARVSPGSHPALRLF